MAKSKRKPQPTITLLTCIVEDILVGPAPRRRHPEEREVSIQVNVLAGADAGSRFDWIRVHKNIVVRLQALAELQGSDGLMGRCCTIGLDENGSVVMLTL